MLECRVRGQPTPRISWFRDGVTLSGSGRHQTSQNDEGICKLIINGPDRVDTGLYTCRAENELWNDQTSQHIHFTGRESFFKKIPFTFFI